MDPELLLIMLEAVDFDLGIGYVSDTSSNLDVFGKLLLILFVEKFSVLLS